MAPIFLICLTCGKLFQSNSIHTECGTCHAMAWGYPSMDNTGDMGGE